MKTTTTPPADPAAPAPAEQPAPPAWDAIADRILSASAGADLAAIGAAIEYDAELQQLIAALTPQAQAARGRMIYTLCTLPIRLVTTDQDLKSLCSADPRLPPPTTIGRWRRDYPGFVAAWNTAMRIAAAALSQATTSHQLRAASMLARGATPAARRLIAETQSQDPKLAIAASEAVLSHDAARQRIAAGPAGQQPDPAPAPTGAPTLDDWRAAAAARREAAAAAIQRAGQQLDPGAAAG